MPDNRTYGEKRDDAKAQLEKSKKEAEERIKKAQEEQKKKSS